MESDDKTMKRVNLIAPFQMRCEDVAEPEPGRGEVKFKPIQIGICGSDMLAFHGKHKYVTLPHVMGHECVGVVEAIGENVSEFHVGDLITVQPQLVCGTCYPCRHGFPNVCENKRFMGINADGFYCEHYVCPAENAIKLPEGFSLDKGMLIEPFAVACNANDRGMVGRDKNVVVLGAGTIGNCVAQVAEALGANVAITDISDSKLEMARYCGIKKAYNTKNKTLRDVVQDAFHDYADIVIDCCAIPAVINQAIEDMGNASRLVLVGTFEEDVKLDLTKVQRRELQLVGVMQYNRKHYLQAIDLLKRDKVCSEKMIQARFNLCEAQKAFEYVDNHAQTVLKVALCNM